MQSTPGLENYQNLYLSVISYGIYGKDERFQFKKFAFDFLGVLLGHSFFFIPATTANDLRLWWISIPDFIHYIFFVLS